MQCHIVERKLGIFGERLKRFYMSKLIYITNTSLDGYIEDQTGAFDWENAEQLHPLFVEILRPIGTYLYGRRLYEKMAPYGESWNFSIRIVSARERFMRAIASTLPNKLCSTRCAR